MKKFTHIFFDLDHTLWDYDYNARKVLSDIYEQFSLQKVLTCSLDGFISTFFKINAELWHYYNSGQISRDDIRVMRFLKVFKACGSKDELLAAEISTSFLYHCPRQTRLMPDADILLNYLQKKYQLSIITNGFEEVQAIKMRSAGLEKYFNYVFTSETTGHRKPEAELFYHALEITKGEKSMSLMIGDNHYTDVMGAVNAGITPLFYNPTGRKKSDCELQVTHLSELMKIL